MSTIKSWADLSDSDEEIIVDYNINKINSFNITNITFEDVSTLVNNCKEKDFVNKIYTYVSARLKNYSQLGLNKMEKNIEEFDNYKVEFYYSTRKLKIQKFYKNLNYDLFVNTYKSLTDELKTTNNIYNFIKKITEICFSLDKVLYLPFFYVDNKYFDIIKHYNNKKVYKLILYPIQL